MSALAANLAAGAAPGSVSKGWAHHVGGYLETPGVLPLGLHADDYSYPSGGLHKCVHPSAWLPSCHILLNFNEELQMYLIPGPCITQGSILLPCEATGGCVWLQGMT